MLMGVLKNPACIYDMLTTKEEKITSRMSRGWSILKPLSGQFASVNTFRKLMLIFHALFLPPLYLDRISPFKNYVIGAQSAGGISEQKFYNMPTSSSQSGRPNTTVNIKTARHESYFYDYYKVMRSYFSCSFDAEISNASVMLLCTLQKFDGSF
uniref:Uncharacterized protein n=1 Tax=Romanomermis culicivorax TaxID=13658 RepID=A0A915IJA8_ROMCU